LFYIFLNSQQCTNSCFSGLSYWFFIPLWGNNNEPVCLLGYCQVFNILFSIFFPGSSTAGFSHVADYFLTILQQDGYCP